MTMTIVPLARIAATLVRKSRNAPSAWSGLPASRVKPTTPKGGTSEMAMATPGSVSEMSLNKPPIGPTKCAT
jgi:hypothetical protein